LSKEAGAVLPIPVSICREEQPNSPSSRILSTIPCTWMIYRTRWSSWTTPKTPR
jgi:hypothetical protein